MEIISKISVIVSVLVLSVLVGCLLYSCGSSSPKVIEKIVEKEVVTEHIVHDTATVEIPVEVEKIVTRDTVSHLENTYAKSDASVSGGFLSHSLESIPQFIKVPVAVTVHDTTYIKEETQVETEYVEKELNWWQKFRLDAFLWLVVIILVLLAWTFRKYLLKLFKIC